MDSTNSDQPSEEKKTWWLGASKEEVEAIEGKPKYRWDKDEGNQTWLYERNNERDGRVVINAAGKVISFRLDAPSTLHVQPPGQFVGLQRALRLGMKQEDVVAIKGTPLMASYDQDSQERWIYESNDDCSYVQFDKLGMVSDYAGASKHTTRLHHSTTPPQGNWWLGSTIEAVLQIQDSPTTIEDHDSVWQIWNYDGEPESLDHYISFDFSGRVDGYYNRSGMLLVQAPSPAGMPGAAGWWLGTRERDVYYAQGTPVAITHDGGHWESTWHYQSCSKSLASVRFNVDGLVVSYKQAGDTLRLSPVEGAVCLQEGSHWWLNSSRKEILKAEGIPPQALLKEGHEYWCYSDRYIDHGSVRDHKLTVIQFDSARRLLHYSNPNNKLHLKSPFVLCNSSYYWLGAGISNVLQAQGIPLAVRFHYQERNFAGQTWQYGNSKLTFTEAGVLSSFSDNYQLKLGLPDTSAKSTPEGWWWYGSSKQDVMRIEGDPSHASVEPDGTEKWIYIHWCGWGGDDEPDQSEVVFDRNDLVSDYVSRGRGLRVKNPNTGPDQIPTAWWPGKTKKQITHMLDKPQLVVTFADGTQQWIYSGCSISFNCEEQVVDYRKVTEQHSPRK